MVAKRGIPCHDEKCKRRSKFNFPGSLNASHCDKHKMEGMIQISQGKCRYCSKGATFGLCNGVPVACKEHKTSEMEDVRQKRRCKDPKCRKYPTFNYEGSKHAEYCTTHKLERMVDVINPKCQHPECKLNPCFNFMGETRGKYCATHKLEGMIDIVTKKCEAPDCDTKASYNFEGNKKGKYCVTHKEPDMVDVVNTRCKHPKCRTRPVFNFQGETFGKYCELHKEDGMVNVTDKRCKHPECVIIPVFNYEGNITPIYCSTHKLEGMVDIVNQRCAEPECSTQPTFNFEGEKYGKYCSLHRLEGMVNVRERKCQEEKCEKRACFNFEGETQGIYCSGHKLDGMIKFYVTYCKTHMCYTEVRNKYEGYCFRCYMYTYPDRPVIRNYKIKEKHVTDAVQEMLKAKGHKHKFDLDKEITGGCTKKRPDMFLDLFTHVLVVEVDENQHKREEYTSCETNWLTSIFSDVAERPTVFLRFNPDKYTEDNKKHKGCFKVNPKGLCVLDSKKEFTSRIEKLTDRLIHYINTIPEKLMTVEYLYYDSL